MWLQLLNQSIAEKPEIPLLMTLATIDGVVGVDARMVVCREIGPDGSLWFTSDSRSRKNMQLARNPNAAAVLWLAHSRHQFRFQGAVQSDTSARDRIWEKLSDATKQSFFWPTPGDKRVSEDFGNAGTLASTPDSFSVLKLSPIVVELLELELTPHRRRRWAASRNWQAEELNP